MEQTVIAVFTKFDTAQTKKGTIFKIWDQYGSEWATFNQSVWENAKQYQGVQAKHTGDFVPGADGFSESKWLKNSEPLNGSVSAQPPNPVPPQANVFAAAEAQPEPPGPIPVAGPEYQRAKHPNEQRAIRKAVALQAAIATLPNLETKLSDPNQVLAIAEVWERWLVGEL